MLKVQLLFFSSEIIPIIYIHMEEKTKIFYFLETVALAR
jgi:hypothetical protein